MLIYIGWVVFLYSALTLVRAPDAWGIGRKADGKNPFASIEPRITANLSNQFEWPILFYVICVLLIVEKNTDVIQLYLAWLFVAGRIFHSAVHILLSNIRLRGVVFTINFIAVLAMWGAFLA